MSEKPILKPNQIGLFIGFEECPRYLKQSISEAPSKKEELGIFLSETGKRFEEEITQEVNNKVTNFSNFEEYDIPSDFQEAKTKIKKEFENVIKELHEEPIALAQVPLKGQIEDWNISGKADLICMWEENNTIFAHVLEIKISRNVRPYHKIQAKIYSILLKDLLEEIHNSLEIKTGIIFQGSSPIDLDNIPHIKNEEVIEDDVRRLLSSGGVIERIFEKESHEINFQLGPKCNQCVYNENCFIYAIRDQNLALLGLTQGEQQILNNHYIFTLSDLAELKRAPEKPRPYHYKDLESLDDDKVKALIDEASISRKLDMIIQKAQAILSKIDPDHPQAQTEEEFPPLQGTGKSALPKTHPTESQQECMEYQADELIRVYLYVRQDYMRDTLVLLGARIVRECASGSPKSFSVLAEELPDEKGKILDQELDLLSRFLEKLFSEIQNLATDDTSAPLHLYFFSRMERDWLIDAILRHLYQWDKESLNAIRDLLGYRQAIDQPMVSIVQDEVRQHFASKYPSDGLLPLVWSINNNFCNCGCPNGFFRAVWKTSRSNGTSIDLWNVFRHNFFDFLRKVKFENGNVKIDSDCTNPDYYPLRARYDNQFPLEYIWAEDGKLSKDWAKNPLQEKEIEKYRWHDDETKNERITREDIKLLGQKLCHALHHLEESLFHAKNIFLGKKAIDIPQISSISLGESNLARSTREYLDLEYFANRQKKLSLFAKSPRDRVRTGKSAIFEVVNREMEEGDLLIEGQLIYDNDEFANPERVANSCRLKGREEATSGSHLVMNQIQWNSEKRVHEEGNRPPRNIEDGLPITVNEIAPSERYILLRASEFHREDKYFVRKRDQFDYIIPHDTWTPNKDEEGTNYGKKILYIREGDRFILDGQTDDWVAQHGADILKEIENVHIYNEINDLLMGDDL